MTPTRQSLNMEVESVKSCSRCRVVHPVSNFYVRRDRYGPKLQAWCKKCHLQVVMEWARRNPERVKAIAVKGRHKTAMRRLGRVYGLTEKEYQNLLSKQDGKCATCGRKPSKEKEKLVVDHCHKTGKIRGLLCSPCNVALGGLRDNPETARRIAAYLEEHHDPNTEKSSSS